MKVDTYIKDTNDRSYKYTMSVCLNEKSNGGEGVILSVDFFENDPTSMFNCINLETTCYGTSSSSITLSGDITLDSLFDAVQAIKEALDERSK